MLTSALVLFPHQLFHDHRALSKEKIVMLCEDDQYFSAYSFHVQKLIFHRASMRAYKESLSARGYTVIYFEYPTARDPQRGLFSILKEKNITALHYIDPVDEILEKLFIATAAHNKVHLIRHETDSFLVTSSEIAELFSSKKNLRLAPFYQKMRRKQGILVRNGLPVGGRWSFDTENRLTFPDHLAFPATYKPSDTQEVLRAKKEILKEFPDNPGSAHNFIYPITHHDAQLWLEDFLEHRLAQFGPYEDAITSSQSICFHSVLSPLLNSGLLTPAHVVKKTLEYAQQNPKTPLNSLEGFVRQIIGWREFVRGVYSVHGSQQSQSNYFNHTRSIPKSFWQGTTNIAPVDNIINKALETGYAHHIERLMIMGNVMLLCEFNPHEVYRWFMELFIDSYTWVMVPNVYGMSQYADGGSMTTKPYISGSNYILKMSDFKKDGWCSIWDALYWHFIAKNKKTMAKNQRMSLVTAQLKKMDPEKLKNHIKKATEYLESLDT